MSLSDNIIDNNFTIENYIEEGVFLISDVREAVKELKTFLEENNCLFDGALIRIFGEKLI